MSVRMNLADYSSFDGVALAELVSISPFSHGMSLTFIFN